MKKIIKFLVFPTLVLGLAACTDLSETLEGDITEVISVEGFDDPNNPTSGGPLDGAYAKLRDGSAGHSGIYSIQELTTDEMVIAAKGGDWFDGGILVQLHQHTYTPVHGFIENAWNHAYSGIAECNNLLENPDLEASQIAQLRALRAFFHMRLLDMFGNVRLSLENGVTTDQLSRSEVFDFVEAELLAALGATEITSGMDLSTSPLGAEVNPYLINTYGALGLLAKLYLNAEVYKGEARYEEAAAAAGLVIDSGVYSLCGDGCSVDNLGRRTGVDSDPLELAGYAAVFAPNNEGNPEHIFTIDYDEVTGAGMNFSQMNLHYSSQFTWNLDAQPWNGYATLEEFYNSYEDGDARKGASFIVGPQLDFGGSAILDYASDDDDIQLSYTPSINEIQPNSLREAGARPGKFSFQQFGRPEMNNDYPLVRLGEMYLVRGEAMARAAGNWNMSLDDVNVIRARAKVAPLASIDADGFLAERGREMFQESARRTDLIRFGKYGDTWWEKPASDASKELFPIPQAQIDISEGALTQNPGY